jgi:hypothetical protein
MLLSQGSFAAVEVQLYSPNRPVVDLSACFLWIMALGTIVCASLWTEFIAMERVDGCYDHLTRKVGIHSFCLPFFYCFSFPYAQLNAFLPVCSSGLPHFQEIRLIDLSDGCTRHIWYSIRAVDLIRAISSLVVND